MAGRKPEPRRRQPSVSGSPGPLRGRADGL